MDLQPRAHGPWPRPRIGPLVATVIVALVACTSGRVADSPTAPGPTTAAPAGPVSAPSITASPRPPDQDPIDPSSLVGQITFSGGPPHAEDVFVIDADGTHLRRVTDSPAADFDPTWSPDGNRIAYRHQAGTDSSTDIDVIDLDGSRPRRLTRNEGVADWGPAWSPTGDQIVWNSDSGTPGRFRGFLMSPDGSNVKSLGVDMWVEYPAWSPDGKRIAFMGPPPEAATDYEIWVANADGTGLRRLTHEPGPDGWPSWSPDGRRILFSSVRDDCTYSTKPDCKSTGDIGPYHTLYVMDADGTHQTRLSDAFGQIADWSPDGRYVVFGGLGVLTVMRADGSGLTRLPTGVVESGFPDWIA
jgi:TolB protein